MSNEIKYIGWPEVLSVFTAINLSLFGFLAFGMVAVTYVLEGFLGYVFLWVARHVYLECREEWTHKYKLNRALNEWKGKR